MSKKSKIPLLLILLSQPYFLYGWGGGDKLSDGSCQFDKETGYRSSSFYIKGNEKFLNTITVDLRFNRTTSTIYNALNCEKITSGDTYKSQFGDLLIRKGFDEIELNNNINSIYFSENEDKIVLNAESITPNIIVSLKEEERERKIEKERQYKLAQEEAQKIRQQRNTFSGSGAGTQAIATFVGLGLAGLSAIGTYMAQHETRTSKEIIEDSKRINEENKRIENQKKMCISQCVGFSDDGGRWGGYSSSPRAKCERECNTIR
jgi:hypothetical protein